jgi:hypothetical protein
MSRLRNFDAGHGNYHYRVFHDAGPASDDQVDRFLPQTVGNTFAVAYNFPPLQDERDYADTDTYPPVAGIEIHAGKNNKTVRSAEQRLMNIWDEPNRLSTPNSAAENEKGQIPGQIRLTGGVMERESDPHASEGSKVDYVKWLHAHPGHERALGGLIGAAIAEHGSIPHADKQLSPDGSRTAKAAARRWGIKGHPSNPDMEPTVPEVHHAGYLTEDIAHRMATEAAGSVLPVRTVTQSEAKLQDKVIKGNSPSGKRRSKKKSKARIAESKAENEQLSLALDL